MEWVGCGGSDMGGLANWVGLCLTHYCPDSLFVPATNLYMVQIEQGFGVLGKGTFTFTFLLLAFPARQFHNTCGPLNNLPKHAFYSSMMYCNDKSHGRVLWESGAGTFIMLSNVSFLVWLFIPVVVVAVGLLNRHPLHQRYIWSEMQWLHLSSSLSHLVTPLAWLVFHCARYSKILPVGTRLSSQNFSCGYLTQKSQNFKLWALDPVVLTKLIMAPQVFE